MRSKGTFATKGGDLYRENLAVIDAEAIVMANDILPPGLQLYAGKTSGTASALTNLVVMAKTHRDALGQILGIEDPKVWERAARQVWVGEPHAPEEIKAQERAWNQPYWINGHVASLCWACAQSIEALKILMILRFKGAVPSNILAEIQQAESFPFFSSVVSAAWAMEELVYPPINVRGEVNLRGIIVDTHLPHLRLRSR